MSINKTEFMKYPKIKIVGSEENQELLANPEDDIVIQEKVDGGNLRLMVKNTQLILGSRNCTMDSDMENSKNWKRCTDFIKSKLLGFNLKELEHRIYYLEACIKHSIHYNFDKMPPVLGFDIYDMKTNSFLSYKQAKTEFERLGITFVPIIKEVKAKDIKVLTDKDIPQSRYYSGMAEGIVFKNFKTQTMAKYVSDKFKEINKDTFGANKKFAKNDNERIIAMYCTNPRIDKCIFKLIDEGNKLDMKLITKLPHMVNKDIMEEQWQEIIYSNYSVDFRKLKQLVGKRCLKVLEQVIINTALSDKNKK